MGEKKMEKNLIFKIFINKRQTHQKYIVVTITCMNVVVVDCFWIFCSFFPIKKKQKKMCWNWNSLSNKSKINYICTVQWYGQMTIIKNKIFIFKWQCFKWFFILISSINSIVIFFAFLLLFCFLPFSSLLLHCT